MPPKIPESPEALPFEKYMVVLSTPANKIGEFILALDANQGAKAELDLDLDAIGVFRGTYVRHNDYERNLTFNYEGGHPHTTDNHPGWQTFSVRSVDAKLTYDPDIHTIDGPSLRNMGESYDGARAITIMGLTLGLKGRATTRSKYLSDKLREGISELNTSLVFNLFPDAYTKQPRSLYVTDRLSILGKTDL